MRIQILTLFPEIFAFPFGSSIVKRALDQQLVKIDYHQLRQWGIGKHKLVDDRPFGGGSGMIVRVDVIAAALDDLRQQTELGRVILLDPRGQRFSQSKAGELAQLEALTFICGRYEGVDERVKNHLVDESLSIGDYILTGGEIPAMVVIDAVVRLVPGVLEKTEAASEDSFSYKVSSAESTGPLLEYPQYTLPRQFQGWSVPEILLSGNHQEIKKWRQEQALKITKSLRPDLAPDRF